VSVYSIVYMLVTSFLDGEGVTFDSASINSTELSKRVTIDLSGKNVTECLNELASLSGCYWHIDANKKLWFKPYGTATAPWVLTATDVLAGATLERSEPKYRNSQFVEKAYLEPTDVPFSILGDGETRDFNIGHPVQSITELKASGVTIAAADIGIKGTDTGKKYYYSVGDPVITQDDGQAILTSAQALSGLAKSERNMFVWVTADAAEIASEAARTGCSGYVSYADQCPEGMTKDQATQWAKDRIAEFASECYTLHFETLRSGLDIGQMLTVNIPEFGLVDVQMLVSRVSAGGNPHRWVYSVDAVYGYVAGDWSGVFYKGTV
jgi:hypothetical protein